MIKSGRFMAIAGFVVLIPHLICCLTWTAQSPMPTARSFLGIASVDGKIYAIGGKNSSGTLATVEIYDTLSDSWTAGNSMPAGRREFGIGVVQGKIYVIGGFDGTSILSSVLEYDPVGDSWTVKSPMPTAREGLAVGAVNDTIYAIGGDDGTNSLDTVEAYDPINDDWASKTALPTARTILACTGYAGKVYAMGGNDVGVNATGVLEVYDPASNSWTSKASLMPRYGLSSAVAGDTIYALGGFLGASAMSVVQSYDTLSDSWSGETGMPTARWGLGAVGIDRKIYAIGGQTLFHGGYTDVNEVAIVDVTGIALSKFAASGLEKSIIVSWRVESESLIVLYLLKKRDGEGSYSEIARISGSGSSPSPESYSYKDEDVEIGIRYYYKLGVVKTNGNTQWYGPVSATVIGKKPFLSISPNPFTEKTVIEFKCSGVQESNSQLPNSSTPQLRIYDVGGREVKHFSLYPSSFILPAKLEWDGRDNNGKMLPSGVYYCRLTQEGSTQTKKILLVR